MEKKKTLSEILAHTKCWSHCPKGWEGIVEKGIWELSPYAVVDQIKEKFGGLRIYLSYPEDVPEDAIKEDDNLLRSLELACKNTCQMCGSELGALQNKGGWLVTLCKKCDPNC